MSVTNAELYNALVVIQKMCREHPNCDGCPLYSHQENDRCVLSYQDADPPADWNLNEPDVYRAIS